MELKEAIRKRISVRGYKTDPVPKEILTEIIETSLRAPSSMNVQPWEITVLAGAPLDELRKVNVEMLSSGTVPVSDFGHAKPYEGVHKERQRALGFELYRLLGIARDDKEKRMEWTMKGFRGFDAPAMIILSADESLEPRLASSDIGGFIQTVCLVALEYGLGTCINGQGILFPDAVRKIAGIPKSRNIYICIAIGYPDWEHPSNKLVSDRESVETLTRWVGFEQ
jgi:nitroreductase